MPDGSPGFAFTPAAFSAAAAAFYVGLGESGWAAEVRAGRAPQPLHPTPRKPVFLRADLDLYLAILAGTHAQVDWLDPRSYRAQAKAEVGTGW